MTDSTVSPTHSSAPQSAPAETLTNPHGAESGAPADAPELQKARKTPPIVYLLLVSAFTVILNETTMALALADINKDLGISPSVGQWLTTGFMLTMAVVIPVTGFLIQRLHTRTLFISAMGLFSTGTLIAATSLGFEMLLAGRIVQATGTAIMMPLLMTTVMTLVHPSARGAVMGNISIVISVAPALGPAIAGLILTHLNWRSLFWVMLPISIGALLLGAWKIPNVTEPRRVPIDYLSVVLSAFGFGGLIFGLTSIAEAAEGKELMPFWIPLTVGILALVTFILRQLQLQKDNQALLDLRTFGSRNFTLSMVMMALSMAALFGSLIMLPLFMQNVMQLEPLTAGLILLPGGLLMGLLAPFVGRLFDRVGPRALIVPGAALVCIVLWSIAIFITPETPIGFMLAMHLTLSVGLALLFTPLFTTSLGSVKRELYSHGSAIIGTLQQLAGAAGTALFVTLFTVQSAALSTRGADYAEAFTGGVRLAFLAGGIVFLCAVLVAFFIRKPEELSEDELASIESH